MIAAAHVLHSAARRAGAVALAAAPAVALSAAPALAQYTAGGVVQDPTVLAQNFLTWFQPLATLGVGGITIGCCVAAAGNARAVTGIAGAGVFATGLIWGFPYIPTAMGALGGAISRT